MNCRNCGAAMTLVAGRDYFRCDYCVSFHFSEGTGEDGVRVVGGPTECDCPVCQERLQDGRIAGEVVQYCGKCRGFLAANPVFTAIVRERRAQRPAGLTPHSFDPNELTRRLDCPRCHKKMDTHPYYGGGRVAVDTCPRCTLIWLDAGELTIIERHNPQRAANPPPIVASAPMIDEPADLFSLLTGLRIVPL